MPWSTDLSLPTPRFSERPLKLLGSACAHKKIRGWCTMRIGIDGHVLGKNIGGVERYVEKVVELVPGLCPQHHFVVFISNRAKARAAADSRHNVEFVTLPMSDPIVQRSVVLPWMVRRHRLDVLQVQRIAPWACGHCRILLTVHDLIPIKYPGSYPGLRSKLVRLLTPASIVGADFIVCPTQFVCDDIERLYPQARAPKRPFYNGVDPERFARPDARRNRQTLARHGIDRPFVFSPGAIEERKNVETIVAALGKFEPRSRPLLLLSGSIRDKSYFAQVQQLVCDLGLDECVRHLGFVSDDDLIDLYSAATVCVAASRDEGFNLLPLEAMACGAPVICSDIAVHRELYDGAALFFPPDNPELLAGAIQSARADKGDRQAILEAAAAVVKRFSWEAMAERMVAYFEDMNRETANI
jgi:glycosyltransferase involved in cell wall biosynthesis